MKKAFRNLNFQYLLITILVFIAALSLPACVGEQRTFDISIRMPAGEGIVTGTSDSEVQAKSGTITVVVKAGTPDASISLLATQGGESIENIYLTHGMPVKIDVKKGCWYKIRIESQGSGNVGYDYNLTVKNVGLRIQ